MHKNSSVPYLHTTLSTSRDTLSLDNIHENSSINLPTQMRADSRLNAQPQPQPASQPHVQLGVSSCAEDKQSTASPGRSRKDSKRASTETKIPPPHASSRQTSNNEYIPLTTIDKDDHHLYQHEYHDFEPMEPPTSTSTAHPNLAPKPKPDRKSDIHGKFRNAINKTKAIVRLNQLHKKKYNDPLGIFGIDGYLDKSLIAPFLYHLVDENKQHNPNVLLCALQIDLEIDEKETKTEKSTWNPEITINIKYGALKWLVTKKITDILSLHTLLTLRKLQGKGPNPPKFPTTLLYIIGKKLITKKQNSEQGEQELVHAIRMFCHAIEQYLLSALNSYGIFPSQDLCAFFQLSSMSVVQNLVWKGAEGYIYTREANISKSLISKLTFKRWQKRWISIRDTYIAVCDSIGSRSPRRVLLYAQNISYDRQVFRATHPLRPHRLIVNCKNYSIILGSDNDRLVESLTSSLNVAMHRNEWGKPHRYNSFAPERSLSAARWFIDAELYFAAVYDAISKAQDHVYIMGWWISPEIYLKRPPAQYPESRLDKLLKSKAEKGVMIYILVYKEVKVSLSINSAYTKRKFGSLHKNIIVQRHPDHVVGGTTFWAHHEKLVVVDNTYGFVGGIDLCFGRWDDNEHRGNDIVVNYTPGLSKTIPEHLAKFKVTSNNFTGQDYSNPRVRDFTSVKNFEMTLIDKQITPRMPWHDIHMEVFGKSVRDVSRHFVERWNFIKRSKSKHRKNVPLLTPPDEQYYIRRLQMVTTGNPTNCLSQVLRSSAEWSSGIKKESSVHTAYCDLINNAEHFIYIENQFFISSITVNGRIVKNQVAECIVNRIIRAHAEKKNFKVIVLVPLMPAFEGDMVSSNAATLKNVMFWQFRTISRGVGSIRSQLEARGIEMKKYIVFYSLRMYDVIFKPAIDPNSPTPRSINRPLEPSEYEEILSKSQRPINPSVSESLPKSKSYPSPDHRAQSEDIHLRDDDVPRLLEHYDINISEPEIDHVRLSSAFQENCYLQPKDKYNMSNAQRGKSATTAANSGLRVLNAQGDSIAPNSKSFRGSLLPITSKVVPVAPGVPNSSDCPENSKSPIKKAQHLQLDISQARERLQSLRMNSIMHASNLWHKIESEFNPDPSTEPDSDLESESESDRRSDISNNSERDAALLHAEDDTKNHIYYSETDEFKKLYYSDEETNAKPKKRLSKAQKSLMALNELDNADYHIPMNRKLLHKTTGGERKLSEPVYKKRGNSLDPRLQCLPSELSKPKLKDKAKAKLKDKFKNRPRFRSKFKPNDGSVSDSDLDTGPETEPELEYGHIYRIESEPEHQYEPEREYEHEYEAKTKVKISPDSIIKPEKRLESKLSPEIKMDSTPIDEENIVKVSSEGELLQTIQVVSEQVYIHCKLMIVDDRKAIIGSANINDRSMMGNRDSEIAILIEDKEMVDMQMDGKPYKGGLFAHSLRMSLCEQHVGISGKLKNSKLNRDWLVDPLSEEFTRLWFEIADTNTTIFRDIFQCIPDNSIRTFSDYKKFVFAPHLKIPYSHSKALTMTESLQALEKLQEVKGNLVLYPVDFLTEESLEPRLGDKENLVPFEVFV